MPSTLVAAAAATAPSAGGAPTDQLLIQLWGCGGSLPLPAQTAPPAEAYVEVPYPPPAALSEMISERPASDTVWRDGGWVWRGRYYVWERGGWVRPGELRFAPWRLRYEPDGQAMFAPGVPVTPIAPRFSG